MEKTQSVSISIIDRFASVEDPRMERTRKRRLENIIAIAIRAVIAGADNWVDIESFGRAKLDRFETFHELPNGIPSHDTFGRVFSLIDAQLFQDAFTEWTKTVWKAAQGQVAAIDGKTVRRSADKTNGKSAIHMAGARASENGVSLGQVKTDDRSNETTAVPELLKTLEIAGCVVTIDAMGCQKKIARQVVKQGADYVLAVKKNQPQLWEDVVGAFEYGARTRFATIEHDSFETVNKGHGRVERRRRLGDVRSVRDRTRERPRRMGEHERRGDDRVHPMVERRDFGSQAALHNEPAGSRRPDSAGSEGALGEWRTVLTGRRRAVRGGRERDSDWTRGGEHVDASPFGAEFGEGGEVSENRRGCEAEEGGLGLGVPPLNTPTRAIRCDCPGGKRNRLCIRLKIRVCLQMFFGRRRFST